MITKSYHTKTATQTNNQEILIQRGIDRAAAAMNWQDSGGKWQYPVYDLKTGDFLAWRFKSYAGGKKYDWLKGQRNGAKYYAAPDLAAAIAGAGGVLWIANGEPSVLAYHAAGVRNVLSWFGENSIPKTIAADLADLRVLRVLYPVDNDKTGIDSGATLRDRITGSGIDCEIYCWQSDREKYDANDFWIDCAFNPVSFNEGLRDLEPATLPAPKRRRIDPIAIETDYNTADLAAAIAHAAENIGYKGGGDWLNGACLFPENHKHGDRNQSAGINRKTGVLNCFACGTYNAHDVASRLGIDWRRFVTERKTRRPRRTPETIDLHEIQDRAAAAKLSIFPATRRVNIRYISDIDPAILGATNAIRSPLATGKTELIIREIQRRDAIAGRRLSVLVISHLQNLAENLADRLNNAGLGFVCYKDSDRHDRAAAPRLVVSYDSLHTAADHYDLIFVDEVDQLHRHLFGGTFKDGAAGRAYEKLRDLHEMAARVYWFDAHLSATSVKLLRDWRGDLAAIENTYRRNWGSIRIEAFESGVIDAAIAAATAQNSAGVVIATNSRAASEKYHKHAATVLGADQVMLINGDISSAIEARDFIRRLTAATGRQTMRDATGKRLLIASPSLGTGIDIQCAVAGVYGVFTNQDWTTGYNIMQSMMRYRNAAARSLAILGAGYKELPIDYRQIYRVEAEKLISTAAAAEFFAHNIATYDPLQETLLELQCRLIADQNVHQNDILSYTIATATGEGFTIDYGTEVSKATGDALKFAAEQIAQDRRDHTMKAIAIAPEILESMRQLGSFTIAELLEARAGVLRYKIEMAAGDQITPDLYDRLNTSRQRAAFGRLVDILADRSELMTRDRSEAQNDKLISHRRHFTRNADLINAVVSACFGQDWLQNENIIDGDRIAEGIAGLSRQIHDDIQIYLDGRRDLSRDPVAQLRRVLGRAGLKLKRAQIMKDRERFYMYWIDPDDRAVMLRYAKRALQARRDRIETITSNAGNTLDIRDRSNETPPPPPRPLKAPKMPPRPVAAAQQVPIGI